MTSPGMTTASWTLLGIAGLVAVADWVAVALRYRILEWICKPLVVVLLAGVAVTLVPVSELRRAYTATALAFSLAGDVLLMLPEPDPIEQQRARARGETGHLELFPFGLAAFLVANLNYVAGFRAGGASLAATALAALLVLPFAVPIGNMIVRAVVARGLESLTVPVIAYIAVVGAMAASAVASGSALAAAGGWLFLLSDATLAWDRFVRRMRWGPLVVAVTYHLAQGLLVASLVR